MRRTVHIGFDPREAAAFAVARHSVLRHLSVRLPVHGLVLADLQAKGLYRRPMEWRQGAGERQIMWDTLSDAPMSTEHANARFLVPHVAGSGWALFMDGDVLVRGNIQRLFDQLDTKFAVYCVKHKHQPPVGVKMDGQLQTQYSRKNWTSVMVWNCSHKANRKLTLDMINTVPGRDLHRLCWIEDDSLIGELGAEWNWLVGETPPVPEVQLAHFTSGTPDMPGYADVQFADEWRAELKRWAA
jgi:hypothetical protein